MLLMVSDLRASKVKLVTVGLSLQFSKSCAQISTLLASLFGSGTALLARSEDSPLSLADSPLSLALLSLLLSSGHRGGDRDLGVKSGEFG